MPPAAVPETALKKRTRDEAWATTRAEGAAKARAARSAARKDAFKRAESYVKEYRAQEADTIRLRRAAKAAGGFYTDPEAKVVLAIRIRGINDMAPKSRKILQLLRLRQIHNAVFIKVNAATMKMLKLVEPYLAFGAPNLKTVRELVLKRGFGKVNGSRIPLTDNAIVEAALGKHGLVCVEDLVHELYTAGPAFKQASNFLWPFKLSAPKGGLSKKRLHYVEGGFHGSHEHKINALVRRMN